MVTKKKQQFEIQTWDTEEHREQGNSSYYETKDNKEEAIEIAKEIYQDGLVACAEVIEIKGNLHNSVFTISKDTDFEGEYLNDNVWY